MHTQSLPRLGLSDLQRSRMRSRIIIKLYRCDIVLIILKHTKLIKYIFKCNLIKKICTLNSRLTREIVLLPQFNKIFSHFDLAYFTSLDLICRILID